MPGRGRPKLAASRRTPTPTPAAPTPTPTPPPPPAGADTASASASASPVPPAAPVDPTRPFASFALSPGFIRVGRGVRRQAFGFSLPEHVAAPLPPPPLQDDTSSAAAADAAAAAAAPYEMWVRRPKRRRVDDDVRTDAEARASCVEQALLGSFDGLFAHDADLGGSGSDGGVGRRLSFCTEQVFEGLDRLAAALPAEHARVVHTNAFVEFLAWQRAEQLLKQHRDAAAAAAAAAEAAAAGAGAAGTAAAGVAGGFVPALSVAHTASQTV